MGDDSNDFALCTALRKVCHHLLQLLCGVPGGQVLGAETILALEDGAMQVCCWWVFKAVPIVPHGCGACVETLICHGH